ncbi:MAG: FAD-binding oxidoreductase [Planctomycetaceae bacterium]
MSTFNSWGNFPAAADTQPQTVTSAGLLPAGIVLPRGLGRSYGDCCLNNGHTLLLTESLNDILNFEPASGIVKLGSGVSFEQLLRLCVPQGWFPPVVPGTKYVTMGGAIANDVHGKNHHLDGTFGRHVLRFELLRSDGSRRVCSPTENEDLYAATIGGIGLTGLIVWAEIQLCRVASADMQTQTVKFANVHEFLTLSDEFKDSRYTVAWVDSLATGRGLGRGHFLVGKHAEDGALQPHNAPGWRSVPCFMPGCTLNRLSVKAFNGWYYHRRRRSRQHDRVHYDPFFFPLDSLRHWNRIYGRRGFVQYQCVVQAASAKMLLERVARSGFGSCLTVMKLFGDRPSPGMMSFPQRGLTLSFDFPVSRRVLAFLDELDHIVSANAGRVYMAKDARMSQCAFEAYYPRWRDFAAYIDPAFCSDFWRRVTGG